MISSILIGLFMVTGWGNDTRSKYAWLNSVTGLCKVCYTARKKSLWRKRLKYLCCQWWSDFSFQINQALLRRWRKLCKRWWETSAQGLWRWEGSDISVSSWNDDNENSSDGVDNDDFDDDDDDDGADGDPLKELFESWSQKSRFLKGSERRWEG